MELDLPAMDPLVSVVIPCYNAEKFVEEAVRSVLNQTYRKLEVIAIDDCSTDRTGEILRLLTQEDDRVKYYRNEENKKLIWTLNFGLDQCRGSLIARMDADDVCHPDRIRKQVDYLVKKNVDVVSCFCLYLNEDSSFHSLNTNFSVTRFLPILFVSLIENPVLHPGALCKRDVLLSERYRHEPETIHSEDYDLWSRMLRKGKVIEVIGDYLLYYRRNTQSVSHLFRDIQNKNQLLISKENILHFLQIHVRKDLHLLILSKRKTSSSFTVISEALSQLEVLRDTFVKCYTISDEDCREIDRWVAARFLRMIVYYVLAAGSVPTMLMGIPLVWKFRKVCLSRNMYWVICTIIKSRTEVRKYRL